MSKEKEWTESFGKKLAVFSRIYTFLMHTWGRMGIGPEIIDWITTEEGMRAFSAMVESFGEKFFKATAPVVEPVSAISEFPIWKTIKRNPELKTVDDYRQALRGKKRGISSPIGDILNQGDLSVGGDRYDLFILSTRDLGLPIFATPAQIYEVALAKFFVECPVWIVPAVCEEYEDQLIGELLYIAIKPIRDHIVSVYRSGARTLGMNAVNIMSAHETCIGNGWVFARPHPKQAE